MTDIDTERLTLRIHRPEDLPDSTELWAHPEVVRYIGGRAFSQEETWAKLLRNIGHWSVLGFGYWVVREKATGQFVGEVGLANFRRDMTPSLEGAPEAGWVLSPRAHGRGYATEAVMAAHDWYERRFGPTRTVCLIDPGNDASIRVATKCGYVEWARGMYKGEPAIVFERLRGPRAGTRTAPAGRH